MGELEHSVGADATGDANVEMKLRHVLDQAPGACFEADRKGAFTFVNKAWAALSGTDADAALGSGWLVTIHEEDRERIEGEWSGAVARRTAFSAEFRIVTGSSEVLWVAANAGPVLAESSDDVAGYLGWLTDITGRVDLERYLEQALMDQVRITEQLRREEALHHALDQQFRAVFERAPLGISVVGFDGRFLQVNQAFCDMTGFTPDKVVGVESTSLLHEDDRERVRNEVLHRLFEERSPRVAMEVRLLRSDGRVRWVLADSSLVRDDNDKPMYIVTLALDITDRKQVEERLAHEASHDPLTGLPNRALMSELMSQSMARTRRRDTTMAVMFVDLDSFKPVNDQYGHAVGDELLEQTGGRLRSALRLGDVVARYGGDEFILLCEDIGGQAGAEIVAGRVCEAMASPFVLSEHTVHIGASLGVVMSQGHDDVDSLLRAADAALYQAKHGGRGMFVIADA